MIIGTSPTPDDEQTQAEIDASLPLLPEQCKGEFPRMAFAFAKLGVSPKELAAYCIEAASQVNEKS